MADSRSPSSTSSTSSSSATTTSDEDESVPIADSMEALTKSAIQREVDEMTAKEQEADRNRRLKEYDWDDSNDDDAAAGSSNKAGSEDSNRFSVARLAKKASYRKMPSSPPKSILAAPASPMKIGASKEVDWFMREGVLVWARIRGFPYWPSIVTVDPIECVTAKPGPFETTCKIHVHFLGYANQRAWVPETDLLPFQGRKAFLCKREKATKAQKSNYTPKKSLERTFEKAIVLAEENDPLLPRERLTQLGFVYVPINEQKNAVVAEQTMTNGSGATATRNSPTKRKRTTEASDNHDGKPADQKQPPQKKRKTEKTPVRGRSGKSKSPSKITAVNRAVVVKSSDEGFVESSNTGTTVKRRRDTPNKSTKKKPAKASCNVRPKPLPLPSVSVTSPITDITDEIVDLHDTGFDDLDSNDEDDSCDNSGLPKLGALVWGKMTSYPYWPCFVTRNPENEYRRPFARGGNQVHVQFFNWNDESGWINRTINWCPIEELKRHVTSMTKAQRDSAIPKSKNMLQKWEDAFHMANATQDMSRRERHDQHVVFYKKGNANHEPNLSIIKPQQVHRDASTTECESSGKAVQALKRRRKSRAAVKRCGRCGACKADDCRKCMPCRNKVKYGGSGSMKNICCLRRRCTTKGYSKSWTIDEAQVEIAGGSSPRDEKKWRAVPPKCSPEKKALSAWAKQLQGRTSSTIMRQFLSELHSTELPRGWTVESNHESGTQRFVSPQGQPFSSIQNVVTHLLDENVTRYRRRRTNSCCPEQTENRQRAEDSNADNSGWLLRNGDKLRYGESSLSTDVAGPLEGRVAYFEDTALPSGWLVKRISQPIHAPAASDPSRTLYIYRTESAQESRTFHSKMDTVMYLEPRGHAGLVLEHFMTLVALRDDCPQLIHARTMRAQSRVSVDLKHQSLEEDFAKHPILAKARLGCLVDMVKLPDIFLDHPTVNVRESSNEMVITDVETEEFIAKKIMYE